MFGEPKDVEGECNARLYLADNYGDGSCTIRCKLDPGHGGDHEESFERDGHPVKIIWEQDESFVCSNCGDRADRDHEHEGTCCRPCPKCGRKVKHYGSSDIEHCSGCYTDDALVVAYLERLQDG